MGMGAAMKPCPHPFKERHASAVEARRNADNLRRRRKDARDVAAYRCQCGAWHVGHSQEQRAVRLRRTAEGAKRHNRRAS